MSTIQSALIWGVLPLKMFRIFGEVSSPFLHTLSPPLNASMWLIPVLPLLYRNLKNQIYSKALIFFSVFPTYNNTQYLVALVVIPMNVILLKILSFNSWTLYNTGTPNLTFFSPTVILVLIFFYAWSMVESNGGGEMSLLEDNRLHHVNSKINPKCSN